jgi:small-conductance mechanosensitive channel
MDSMNQLLWQEIVLRVFVYYFAAWVIQRAASPLAAFILWFNRFLPGSKKPSEERITTLKLLLSSIIRFVAVAAATIATLGLFVDVSTLVWVVGLFSAAFGLGARPLINDILAGFAFMFEDSLAMGDKVELMTTLGSPGVQGVVEKISLRSTRLRAPSGELLLIPNGELRVVRNFSRGQFSLANVVLTINSKDLGKAIEVLEGLAQEAVHLLPNLLEPWKVISDSGVIGVHTQLILVTKARYGKAAEIRPRLLELVRTRLSDVEVELVN